MQEKDIVLDILSVTKASLANYAKIIIETGDLSLRAKYQQMRDADEKFQLNLYQVADQKGYYTNAPTATTEDMQRIKQALMQGQMTPQVMIL